MTAVLAMLAGCGSSCPSLPLVPVSWATPEEEQVLRDALGGFEEALALPVCIDHVRMGRPFRGGGQYNPVTRGITLLPPPQDFPGDVAGRLHDSLLHEVCHGVDLQNDVVDGREDAFPFPLDSGFHRAEGHLPHEAFAETCGLGPEALAVVGRADCPDDPDLRGADIVASEVFALGDGGSTRAWHEPQGSEPTDEDVLPELFGVDLLGSSRVADLLPGWAQERSVTLGEHTLVVARLGLPTGTVTRFSTSSGGGWAPVDDGPCPNESTDVFVLDGRIWSIQIDDDVLSWGTWSFAGP